MEAREAVEEAEELAEAGIGGSTEILGTDVGIFGSAATRGTDAGIGGSIIIGLFVSVGF